jgi:hypothetical protein
MTPWFNADQRIQDREYVKVVSSTCVLFSYDFLLFQSLVLDNTSASGDISSEEEASFQQIPSPSDNSRIQTQQSSSNEANMQDQTI